MKYEKIKLFPVTPRDRFPFKCICCGICCRYVRESVLLESMDVFRLAGFLRKRDESIRCMDDVLAQYAKPVLLHESGYTVFVLLTVGPKDECIFLKDNRCTVHEAKPRACRTYPISVTPDMNGGMDIYLSMERTHHFKGPHQSVEKWVGKRCSRQDMDFLETDFALAAEISKLLSRISAGDKYMALRWFMRYKYSEFDLDKPFNGQYRANIEKLLKILREMAEG